MKTFTSARVKLAAGFVLLASPCVRSLHAQAMAPPAVRVNVATPASLTDAVGAATPPSELAAITDSDVRRILSGLASDSMQGRMTGTRGARRAAALIAREMKAIGLVPSGDTAYYQRVAMAEVQPGQDAEDELIVLDSIGELKQYPDSDRRIGFNVIGALPGSDPVLKNQVVIIAAHFDHLGIGKAVKGDSIYNGADDDASGVTAVLEIARALSSGPRPKRTVVFMTTTGEEEGTLGTKWYVEHPKFPLHNMVAEMEVEMIGRPDSAAGGEGKAWLTGYNRSTMGEMLKANGVPIVADPYPQMHFFERSDNIVFAEMGIPAHTLSSYNLHHDYHSVRDDVSGIDFDHVTEVIRAGAQAARLLVDGPAPTWKPGGRPGK